jgi:hypothetical protein
MSTTYSKYVAGATSDIEVLFAKWQILVNDVDITKNTNSTVSFVPTIEENENVQSNTIAPSSKGYFDINIDPSNADVSFKYTISLAVLNEDMPDLMITKYAVLPENYIEGDSLDLETLNNSTISDNLIFDKNTEDFKFKPFTIRVFFEWYEGQGESMDDQKDSEVGSKAATDDTKFKMSANIAFEQIFN